MQCYLPSLSLYKQYDALMKSFFPSLSVCLSLADSLCLSLSLVFISMPKLCLPHVAHTQRQQHKRLCWYFFVFYDCLPQLFRHRYWRRRSAACGCNCDCGSETRTQTVAATVQVTRTATGCRCCCCLYGFCTSFILEGGLAAIPVAVAAASQLTLANGNGVNVATVVAATVPATATAATATLQLQWQPQQLPMSENLILGI